MFAAGELHELLGVEYVAPKAPELHLSDAFVNAIRSAMEGAGPFHCATNGIHECIRKVQFGCFGGHVFDAQQFVQLPRRKHLGHDVTATDELLVHIELWDRRPADDPTTLCEPRVHRWL